MPLLGSGHSKGVAFIRWSMIIPWCITGWLCPTCVSDRLVCALSQACFCHYTSLGSPEQSLPSASIFDWLDLPLRPCWLLVRAGGEFEWCYYWSLLNQGFNRMKVRTNNRAEFRHRVCTNFDGYQRLWVRLHQYWWGRTHTSCFARVRWGMKGPLHTPTEPSATRNSKPVTRQGNLSRAIVSVAYLWSDMNLQGKTVQVLNWPKSLPIKPANSGIVW